MIKKIALYINKRNKLIVVQAQVVSFTKKKAIYSHLDIFYDQHLRPLVFKIVKKKIFRNFFRDD